MGVSVEELIAELRVFDGRRQIVKAMRRGLEKAAKTDVKPAIVAHALAILPKSGGLAAYVAAARIAVTVRYGGRSAGVGLRGRRGSKGGRSDLDRIDRGSVRAPAWGRRSQWHTETVAPGWFTTPAAESTAFTDRVDQEVDRVLEELRR